MKVLILGDISPTERSAPLFQKKDTAGLFHDVQHVFQGQDLVVANLECVLTDSDRPIRKIGPALKAPMETAEVLRSVGVTCCSMSNNHIFDFGIAGANDTLEALRRAGIDHTGYGDNESEARKPYVFQKDGERVCVIAVCEHEYSYALPDRAGACGFDEFETPDAVRRAKAACDRVIVLYHGGKELCRYPSPRLVRVCRALARAGADAVLCQHSHCIGAYERYENCHILYGQGNFHFNKPHDFDGWHTAFAVTYDTADSTMSFIPVKEKDAGIALVEGEEKSRLLTAFGRRCRAMSDGSWKEGWHAFCLESRENYEKAVADAFSPEKNGRGRERFGHYLDCEAHLDVWKELFPTWNQTNEK